MGIYDRDYYREQPKGFLLGPDTSGLVVLIIVNAACFLTDFFFAHQRQDGSFDFVLSRWMHVSPRTLTHPELWWQFLTYGFAHAGIAHLVGNMFTLGYFGRDIEAIYGRREFVRFYLFTVVLCGVYWSAKEYFFFGERGAPLIGASGAVSAVLFLFVMHYPTRTIFYRLIIPMPAWLFGAGEVIWNMLAVKMPGADGGSRIAFDVHLLGIAFAVVYHFFSLRISAFWPSLRWLKISKRRFRGRGELKVHRPPEDVFDPELEREGDRLLAKLNESGEASLTNQERQTLSEYSRQMQAKLRRRNESS